MHFSIAQNNNNFYIYFHSKAAADSHLKNSNLVYPDNELIFFILESIHQMVFNFTFSFEHYLEFETQAINLLFTYCWAFSIFITIVNYMYTLLHNLTSPIEPGPFITNISIWSLLFCWDRAHSICHQVLYCLICLHTCTDLGTYSFDIWKYIGLYEGKTE